MEGKIPLKITIRQPPKVDEHRRLLITTETTYDDLLKLIRVHLDHLVSLNDFKIQYLDDEKDLISLESDQELTEAKKMVLVGHLSDQSKPVQLSLVVSLNHQEPTTIITKPLATEQSGTTTRPALTKEEVQQILKESLEAQSEHLLQTISQKIDSIQTAAAPVVAPAPRVIGVVHRGIICDGCNKHICGIRYKCVSCPDYDLCEACEGKDVHEHSHMFLKVRRPRNLGVNVLLEVRVDGEVRPELAPPPVAPVTPVAAPRQPATTTTTATPSSSTATTTTTTTTTSTSAPVAEVVVEESTPTSCKPVKRSMDVYMQVAERISYDMQFQADETIPDGTIVEKGADVVKCWRVKNNGQKKWGSNIKLEAVSKCGKKMIWDVPHLQPGMTGSLAVTLTTPDESGRHRTVFRLKNTDNGLFFGHRVWMDVIVAPEAPATDDKDLIDFMGDFEGGEPCTWSAEQAGSETEEEYDDEEEKIEEEDDDDDVEDEEQEQEEHIASAASSELDYDLIQLEATSSGGFVMVETEDCESEPEQAEEQQAEEESAEVAYHVFEGMSNDEEAYPPLCDLTNQPQEEALIPDFPEVPNHDIPCFPEVPVAQEVEVPVVEEHPEETPEDFSIMVDANLIQLKDMGFCDVALNTMLLMKHKGDLQQVVSSLLQEMDNDWHSFRHVNNP